MKGRKSHLVVAAFLSLVISGHLSAQTTIDTRTGPERLSDGSWGTLNTGYLRSSDGDISTQGGQTFVAPLDNTLNSFSFWLFDQDGRGSKLAFRAYMMEWQPGFLNRPVGDVLWRSNTVFAESLSYDRPTRYDFVTSGIELIPGSMYVAFLSPVEEANPLSGSNTHFAIHYRETVGTLGEYTGGGLVHLHAATSLNDITQERWSNVAAKHDASFVAEFSPSIVPEPSTFVLVGIGFVGFAGAALRKRTRS
jgi:hypothetical protein